MNPRCDFQPSLQVCLARKPSYNKVMRAPFAGEMILAVSSGVKTTQKVKLWKLSWTLFGLGRGGVI
jgi:hypothetical protein